MYQLSGMSFVISVAYFSLSHIFMLAASNVTVWRPSVCPVGILTVTHQGAACDAASVHFDLTASGTDIRVVGRRDGPFNDNLKWSSTKMTVRHTHIHTYRFSVHFSPTSCV